MEMMKKLEIGIYTDGACSGNPGAGGWAALILMKVIDKSSDHKKVVKKEKIVVKGGEKNTTNNRMELTAVIESLKFVHKNVDLKEYKKEVTVFSDSSYVVNSINGSYVAKWQRNGWKTSKDTDVVNKDLWEKLIKLNEKLDPKYQKVKGHSDDKFNNYVDGIAVGECAKYKTLLNKLK